MSHSTQGAAVIGTDLRVDGLRAGLSTVGLAALLALPGALVLYFSFNSGGIFEVTTAIGALVVLVSAIVALAVARRPFAGISPLGLLALGLLGLFGVWTLLSSDWSHATGRSLISFDRVLLYVAVLGLFASVPSSVDRVRWLLRGLLAASAAVAIIGLVSRLLPAVWSTTPGLVSDRLSYPITYWNTFALLVGMACILAVHHTSDEHEPPAVRIAAAALLPILGATLLLTFSRGALAVTALAIVSYMLIARPWGLIGGIVAVVPPTALAVAETYSSELIQEGTPLTPTAISQGHSLAWTIGGCALAAAGLRAAMLVVDARLSRISVSSGARRAARIGSASAVAVLLVAFVAVGGPAKAHHQYEKFVNDSHDNPGQEGGQRGRLLNVGNDGRLPLWRAGLDGYREDQLKGTGAGTYRLTLEKSGQSGYDRYFAYSLYVETLSELGLVGIGLLGAGLLTILVAIAIRMRAETRPAFAAGFALGIAWIIHAGVDLDWQTPAVCIPFFAIGGLALSRPPEDEQQAPALGRLPRPAWFPPTPWATLAASVVLAALAVFPAKMALAQFRLETAVNALNDGECHRAAQAARDSSSALDVGARPREVLAACAARGGNYAVAVRQAKTAISSEPANWEPHFVLALVQASSGADPRAELQVARRLNPSSPYVQAAFEAPVGDDPRSWREFAAETAFSMQ